MKKFLKTIGTAFIAFFTLLVPTIASAQHGLNRTAEKAGLAQYGSDIQGIVGNVIGAGLSMVGVLFFVLVVYGGILWMTARGNQDQVTKGRNTIIAAAIGLIVVLASYAITNFVLTSVQQQAGSTGGGVNINRVSDTECSNQGGTCQSPEVTSCPSGTSRVGVCTSNGGICCG